MPPTAQLAADRAEDELSEGLQGKWLKGFCQFRQGTWGHEEEGGSRSYIHASGHKGVSCRLQFPLVRACGGGKSSSDPRS
jgi:hypothetical protein